MNTQIATVSGIVKSKNNKPPHFSPTVLAQTEKMWKAEDNDKPLSDLRFFIYAERHGPGIKSSDKFLYLTFQYDPETRKFLIEGKKEKYELSESDISNKMQSTPNFARYINRIPIGTSRYDLRKIDVASMFMSIRQHPQYVRET